MGALEAMDAPVSVKDLLDGNGKFKLLTDLPKRVRSRLLRVKTDAEGRIYSFAFKPHPMTLPTPIAQCKLPAAKRSIAAAMRDVARVAFFDPGKLFDDKGRLKPMADLDDDTAAVVESFEVIEKFEGTGKARRLSGLTKKITLRDKNAALDMAMTYLGLYDEDNKQLGQAIAQAKKPAARGPYTRRPSRP